MIFQNIMLILEIIAEIAMLLYLSGTILAYMRIKSLFVCKSCHKINSTLQNRCAFCNNKMKQWIGVYISFTRKRVDCKNTDNVPDLKKSIKVITLDVILEIICIALITFLLTYNIVPRLG